MERAGKIQGDQQHQRPASAREADPESIQPFDLDGLEAGSSVGSRADLIALSRRIGASPYMVAQRRLRRSLFGSAVQLKSRLDDEEQPKEAGEDRTSRARSLMTLQAMANSSPRSVAQRKASQQVSGVMQYNPSSVARNVVQVDALQTGFRFATTPPSPAFHLAPSESGDAVIQRQVLARFEIFDDKKGAVWILEVVIGGRTPSPFPGTMGAHSTAWIAHLDAVRRMLVNTELLQGVEYLIFLANEGLKSPLLKLSKFLEKDHLEKLEGATKSVQNDIVALDKAVKDYQYPPSDRKFLLIESAMRQLIDTYSTYMNYLPMATVKGGDPSGHGEGSARSDSPIPTWWAFPWPRS
jgi:hypothetical protein